MGSVALSDYREGPSDVDFVAVSGEVFSEDELDSLQEIHHTMHGHGKPWFDGIYVTWDDLLRNPSDIEHVPFNLGKTFARAGGAEANLSVWLTLRNHPFAIRGPHAPVVWYGESAIQHWTMSNLSTYWRSQAERLDDSPPQDRRSMDRATLWCVAGAARLHYTITALDVTSKSGACHYALTRFPERWHAVIGEAQTVRSGGSASRRSLEERRVDVRDFVRFVIQDARAELHGPS